MYHLLNKYLYLSHISKKGVIILSFVNYSNEDLWSKYQYQYNFSDNLHFTRKGQMITSEREARKPQFSVVYWKNLSMSGPARPDPTTLFTSLYICNPRPDSRAVFFGG